MQIWVMLIRVKGKYKKAIQYHEKDLAISTAIGDQSGIATSNGNLGNAYHSLGQYEKAIACHEKNLEISTAIGKQSGIAASNGNLGNAYQSLGQYEKAIEYHEKDLEISVVIGDRSSIAGSHGNLGITYDSLGQYEKAIEYHKKHLEISTTIGDQSGIATSSGNLGNAYYSLGQYEKAIQYHEKHLEMRTAIGYQSGIAASNANLGNAYHSLGQYEKAIQHHEKHLEISTSIGDQSGVATGNGNLSLVYLSLGEYGKAIKCHEKDLEISNSIGDQSGIARSNVNLGNAYHDLGQYEKAIKYHEKSLKISTAVGDQSCIATSDGNLGNYAYCSLGKYEKAIEYHEKSLEINTAIGDQSSIAANNGSLGEAYGSLGQYEKAIQHHEKHLEISTAIGDLSGIATSNGNLGHCHRCVGEHEVALPYLGRAIKLFDKIFSDMVPDRSKLTYTGLYFKFHKISMACLVAVNNLEAALLVMDLGRAKELSFCLQKQRKYSKGGSFEYANPVWETKQTKQELKEIEIVLEVETYSATVLFFAFDLQNHLNVWIFSENLIHRKLDVSFEALNSLIFGLLGKFDVSVGRDCSFFNFNVRFASNENNIFHSEKSNRKPPSKSAADSFVSVDREILRKMCQLMIDPVNDLIASKKLIIVPDKSLFFAPFSSLIDEHGCYLSHSYSVQITPSLHSLRASMEKPPDPKLGIALFVGNPAVGRVSLHGKAFSDLPSAAQEVESISKLFQATPLSGRDAQKRVVMELLDKASIIHIAAHGEPTSGEIILAPYRSQGQSISSHPMQEESFLLTQEDIVNISVKARLVVLCCCYTGQGRVTSEGVIGITRAFLAAGARSVLATLWPIDDTATKEFMEKLYEYLCQELRVCEALRRTKNIFQNYEKPRYQSVKIWAPFTIYGEDVKFEKDEIEKIKEKSRRFFDGFVVLS